MALSPDDADSSARKRLRSRNRCVNAFSVYAATYHSAIVTRHGFVMLLGDN